MRNILLATLILVCRLPLMGDAMSEWNARIVDKNPSRSVTIGDECLSWYGGEASASNELGEDINFSTGYYLFKKCGAVLRKTAAGYRLDIDVPLKTSGISSHGDIAIYLTGSATIGSDGVRVDDGNLLLFGGGQLTVSGNGESGIYGKQGLSICGPSVTVSGFDTAIDSPFGDLLVSGSTVACSAFSSGAMCTGYQMNILGAVVTMVSSQTDAFGIDAHAVVVEGSMISAVTHGPCLEAYVRLFFTYSYVNVARTKCLAADDAYDGLMAIGTYGSPNDQVPYVSFDSCCVRIWSNRQCVSASIVNFGDGSYRLGSRQGGGETAILGSINGDNRCAVDATDQCVIDGADMKICCPGGIGIRGYGNEDNMIVKSGRFESTGSLNVKTDLAFDAATVALYVTGIGSGVLSAANNTMANFFSTALVDAYNSGQLLDLSGSAYCAISGGWHNMSYRQTGGTVIVDGAKYGLYADKAVITGGSFHGSMRSIDEDRETVSVVNGSDAALVCIPYVAKSMDSDRKVSQNWTGILPSYYGTEDLYADSANKLYFWLPEGTTVGGGSDSGGTSSEIGSETGGGDSGSGGESGESGDSDTESSNERSAVVGGCTWTYTVTGGVAVVRDCSPYVENMVIPSAVGGYPVRSIERSAFSYWGRSDGILKSVKIPESVREIGESAFSNNKTLRTVTLSQGLEYIGPGAFTSCSIAKLHIPASVVSMSSAFSGNPIAALTVADGNRYYSARNNCLLNAAGTFLYRAPDSSTVIMPDSVVDMAAGAFYGKTNIVSVLFSRALTNITDVAFCNCTALREVAIPSGVEAIRRRAFYNCTSLSKVSIPTSVTHIYEEAFSKTAIYDESPDGCVMIDGCVIGVKGECPASVTIPAGSWVVADYAFSSCEVITNLVFPDGLSHIGMCAFSGCSKLRSVSFGEGLKWIGFAAFHHCEELGSVAFPDSLEFLGDVCFANTGMGEVVIPGNVFKIGSEAFQYSANLTNAVVVSTHTHIGYDAFPYRCKVVVGQSEPQWNFQVYDFGMYTENSQGETVPCEVFSEGDPIMFYADIRSYKDGVMTNLPGLMRMTVTQSPGDTKTYDFENGIANGKECWYTRLKSLAVGEYTLSLSMDASSVVSEADLSDNARTVAFKVVAAEPSSGDDGDDDDANDSENDVAYEMKLSTCKEKDGAEKNRFAKGSEVWACVNFQKTSSLPFLHTNCTFVLRSNGDELLSFDADVATYYRTYVRIDDKVALPAGGYELICSCGSTNEIGGSAVQKCTFSIDAFPEVSPNGYFNPLAAHQYTGVLLKNGALAGVVAIKTKAMDKKYNVKVSGSLTDLVGKKHTVKGNANCFSITQYGNGISVNIKGYGDFTIKFGEDSSFRGALGASATASSELVVQSASVGGSWTASDASVTVETDDVSMIPGTVQTQLLPNREPIVAKNGKWSFRKASAVKWTKNRTTKEYGLVVDQGKDGSKANLSGLKLTYTSKTGAFKGSYKIFSLVEQRGRTILKKYTVKVNGFVIDGVGYGTAVLKSPAANWSVVVK